jgi:hypothetical protein
LHVLCSLLGLINPGDLLQIARIRIVRLLDSFTLKANVKWSGELLADVVVGVKFRFFVLVTEYVLVLADVIDNRTNQGFNTERAKYFEHNHVWALEDGW